jgi:hypothetical protein
MQMIDAIGPVASVVRIGRSVWVWPVGGALLAAWPIWRSFLHDVPDVGQGLWRGQFVAALAELALVGLWVARYRERASGFLLPLLAIGVAALVMILAGANGDAPTVDLATVAICWLAVVFLFAGAVLLEGQRATRLRGAVPPVTMLLRAHQRIGYWLFGIALAAMAALEASPPSILLAALAAVSPGAVLIWAALCHTARSVLARRRAYVGDPGELFALTEHRALLFGDRGMLIAGRPKVISIMPAGENKPGEIVGIATALLAEQDSEAARGLQDFGVAHRLRLPAAKPLDGVAPQLCRGRLPDSRVVEVGLIEAAVIAAEHRAPFADQLARAAELHRAVLALSEVEPSPRLLGLLVLARAARPGAAETVRTLRKAGFALALGASDVDPRDHEALTALALDDAADVPAAAIGLARPGQPPLGSCAATIHFGGRAKAVPEDNSAIVIARDDPRTVVDMLQFARDFRKRARIAVIAANLPGIALLAAALGHVPGSPLMVSGAALAGVVLAAAMPQALRLSATLANEVDEE